MLANRPALTLGLLCERVDYLDFRFKFFRLILQMQCEGLAGCHSLIPFQTFVHSVISNAQGLSFSGVTSQIRMLTSTMTQHSVLCISVSRGKGFVLACLFCEPG